MICIVESWLSSDILDNEIVIPDYQIFRCDRDRHGGGVLMYVHVSFAVVDLCDDVDDIELLTVSVCPPKSSLKFCISLYYRPPSASVKCFDCVSRSLCNLNPSSFSKFILLGDFNVNFFCTTSFLCTHLIYSLSPFNLTQVVQSGTHISPSGVSLIDLIFVSSTSFLYTCSSLPPLGTSDHSGLQLVVKMMCLKKRKGCQRTLWKYSQGDYRKARHMIDMLD